MSITHETFTKPNFKAPDYLRFNHPTASSNAQQAIEKVWDMTIPVRPELTSLQAQLDALAQVRKNTTTDAPQSTLRHLLETTPADKLDQAIDQAALAHARAQFMNNAGGVNSYLTQQLHEERRGSGQFDHVLDSLPLEDVQDQFTAAAHALGDHAYSAAAALNHDPEALQVLTEAGRKLSILQHLRHNNDRTGITITHTRPIAFYSTLPELPDLPVTRAPLEGTTPLYGPEERQPHTIVEAATYTAHKYPGVYLVALAQGKFPGLTLSVARSYKELASRRVVADRAGKERLDLDPDRRVTPQRQRGTVL